MSHHLTLDDRIKLEQGIMDHKSIREIAKMIGVCPSTVMKEINLHKVSKGRRTGSMLPRCSHKDDCLRTGLCHDSRCTELCSHCSSCQSVCPDYQPDSCPFLKKSPHVCNACPKVRYCTYERVFYYPAYANDLAQNLLISAREGINMDPDEMKELDDLVSPLIRRGQPLAHIYSAHGKEISCSRATLYRYIDRSFLSARNLDLPRKVTYKLRKKGVVNNLTREEKEALKARNHEKFQEFLRQNQDVSVVEMDTVVGPVHTHKVLLTLLFRSCSLMLAVLLPEKTQENVVSALNEICSRLGIYHFQKLFGVILTDRGTEFTCPEAFECDENGEIKTKVFYCDPQCAWQKGQLEKNHEYIRKVVPKGSPFDPYSQEDIDLMINHINSVGRDKFNGASPYDLSKIMLNSRIHEVMRLDRISPDEITLKPSLLKKHC